MKMKEPHVIPLAPPAVALMRRLASERIALDGKLPSDALAFSYASDKAISDMTMLKVLRDMSFSAITVHGFRSTFTDWAAEQTAFPKGGRRQGIGAYCSERGRGGVSPQ